MLRKTRSKVVGFLFVVLTTPAFGQASLFDNCRTVITDGLREYAVSTESVSYLNTVFDKYCDRNGSTKAIGVATGIDTVIKAVPVRFTGNYSSSEEGWRNFCRNYSSQTALNTDRFNYQERIVARAYDSFDACVALAAVGIATRHKVENIARANFFVQAGFARPVTIRGINATPNVTCEGVDPTSADRRSATFNASSVMRLANDNVLGMVCTRSGDRDAAGNITYDEGIVTVLTDISPNGNYTIFMPRDTKLADNIASAVQRDIAEKVKELKGGINAALSQLPTFQQGGGAAYDMNANVGEAFPGSKADCPPGHFAAGLETYVERGDGHLKTLIKCWRLPTLSLP